MALALGAPGVYTLAPAPLQALTLMSSGDRTQLTYQEQGQDSHTFLSAQ